MDSLFPFAPLKKSGSWTKLPVLRDLMIPNEFFQKSGQGVFCFVFSFWIIGFLHHEISGLRLWPGMNSLLFCFSRIVFSAP
jgi:hypothetical protein